MFSMFLCSLNTYTYIFKTTLKCIHFIRDKKVVKFLKLLSLYFDSIQTGVTGWVVGDKLK